MKRTPPPKQANPIEHFQCRHCQNIGLRYQGSINRARGLSEIYKCVACDRRNENPKRPEAKKQGPVHPYHDVSMSWFALARTFNHSVWRA